MSKKSLIGKVFLGLGIAGTFASATASPIMIAQLQTRTDKKFKALKTKNEQLQRMLRITQEFLQTYLASFRKAVQEFKGQTIKEEIKQLKQNLKKNNAQTAKRIIETLRGYRYAGNNNEEINSISKTVLNITKKLKDIEEELKEDRESEREQGGIIEIPQSAARIYAADEPEHKEEKETTDLIKEIEKILEAIYKVKEEIKDETRRNTDQILNGLNQIESELEEAMDNKLGDVSKDLSDRLEDVRDDVKLATEIEIKEIKEEFQELKEHTIKGLENIGTAIKEKIN